MACLADVGFATGIPTDPHLYVAYENSKPGSPNWVLSNEANDSELEGFAGATSVERGDSITFYINSTAASYTLEIFRLGWYGGAGARQVLGPISLRGQHQYQTILDTSTYLLECTWSPSYTLLVPIDPTDPTNWLSGIYVAKLTSGTTGHDKFISFVVRDSQSTADIFFNSGAATFQAYNNWGGKSLYDYNSTNGQQAYKVSYNRPFYGYGGAGYIFQYEYNSVRFLERNGYDVTYMTDIDLHEGTARLKNHKAFVNMSHDEYYTWQMMTNVRQARDAGVHLGFFTANEMYWQIRLEPSRLTGAPDRTQVEYRDPKLDPYNAYPPLRNLVTTNFRSPPVNYPEQNIAGEMFSSAVTPNIGGYAVLLPSHWAFAGLEATSSTVLPNLVGREIDHHFPVPAMAVVTLAKGFINNDQNSLDYAEMTDYEAPSGAVVFAAGSMMWAWTLDSFAYGNEHPDLSSFAAQQITKNVLERFGAYPHAVTP